MAALRRILHWATLAAGTRRNLAGRTRVRKGKVVSSCPGSLLPVGWLLKSQVTLRCFCSSLIELGLRVTHAFHLSTGSLAGSCLADRCLWDKLHAQPRLGCVPTFDWFFGYEEVQGLLLPLLQGSQAACPLRVLDVGCGTSSLCTGLYTKCPHPVDVLGVDFSPVAVAHMNRVLEGGQGQTPLCPGHPASCLHFMQADAQNLEPVASSGSFQLVLDKGTWDAVARGGLPGAYQVLSECLRVLHPQGTLIQFSDEDPDVRLPCLEQRSQGRTVTVQEIGPFRGITYFAYLVQGSH
ncbi:citrate synthase-lysine N-methyltransferase CSKMT, mitochondrial isoform X1 [Phyllostomus discolor]|uniref:Citrate synthase-lysine N-methyltransferase CSKMT, mitochondrial n=1 Tax=Phyllostomus discolor TaxID=89673 RepID=A0A7E6E298_9CHIR|nr:citrate synthase-lysine N-methyltransferase CSKMT, mitochondrial isoform X1 [Phyllostomus discolor]XP_035885489.1 citrate synthase-lysine N-methyltransferase CSKMT, mitochondrial isoform X1 [Phyllostomus discolor]XP_035885490.1 citrate synthase-lysine N-methyltransferase CSKMT, mitochondrial isoform X1 [Phyllostomus discolor]XP_035885491.1 citrate synthase-lysine N-methyltransferase CSKMT, mitochondrial isoform X1 [Phyllostomus discolor]XP_035885492.1 citrate synthase-lysine N-methyltransfer